MELYGFSFYEELALYYKKLMRPKCELNLFHIDEHNNTNCIRCRCFVFVNLNLRPHLIFI